MMSSGINLVMTVIGFAVSTMFIVFVCTRLICARIHLNASRRSFPIASRSDLSILERGLHGLEPVVVANFPTKKYSDEFFSAAGDAHSAFRSHYHAESFDTHSYHCMATGNGLPLRTHDNRGRGPPEEDHFTAECERAESGENVGPLSEGNQRIKDSGTKHVESLSNL
ncbi:hypothetical protein CJ030_MR1G015652 [Morella rubra]|uniref:Uncharacterized protein n=1 Tax=Morella rubra TaxID=262757 RepID=A0A6A1WJ78_9ROSI|nr:hypothetical protein CJ030_MR1G015652 [Morella rubra]